MGLPLESVRIIVLHNVDKIYEVNIWLATTSNIIVPVIVFTYLHETQNFMLLDVTETKC